MNPRKQLCSLKSSLKRTESANTTWFIIVKTGHLARTFFRPEQFRPQNLKVTGRTSRIQNWEAMQDLFLMLNWSRYQSWTRLAVSCLFLWWDCILNCWNLILLSQGTDSFRHQGNTSWSMTPVVQILIVNIEFIGQGSVDHYFLEQRYHNFLLNCSEQKFKSWIWNRISWFWVRFWIRQNKTCKQGAQFSITVFITVPSKQFDPRCIFFIRSGTAMQDSRKLSKRERDAQERKRLKVLRQQCYSEKILKVDFWISILFSWWSCWILYPWPGKKGGGSGKSGALQSLRACQAALLPLRLGSRWLF